jgi:SulP family sulfate permease
VAPFAAAALASSRYLQTGCTALSSLLAGSALLAAGLAQGTPEFGAAAALLALLVGASRVLLGALNGGALVDQMPHTVLEGFTLGAVWLVAATQLPVMLGAAPPPGMHYLAAAAWLLVRPQLWQLGTLATAAVTVACLLGGRRCAACCVLTRRAGC